MYLASTGDQNQSSNLSPVPSHNQLKGVGGGEEGKGKLGRRGGVGVGKNFNGIILM